MKQREEDAAVNMTPMIDVVFQLIIFFVVSIDMQNKQTEMNLRLAMSPNGKAVERKDPRTVYVDVERTGLVRVAGGRINLLNLQALMTKLVRENGQGLPVVIRADAGVMHDEVRKVIDICARAGLWRIKFAAIKEAAKPQGG
jgi:biopolymer transport protein ExbD